MFKKEDELKNNQAPLSIELELKEMDHYFFMNHSPMA